MVFPLLAVAIWQWGTGLDWELEELDLLTVFPLLGMIAFTTMWWHFLVGFVAQIKPNFTKFKRLHLVSGYWVFVAIVLHPLLFWVWGVGEGFASPLDIYKAYLGDDYRFALLGTLGLFVFLLYDLARWLRERPFIKRYWWVVDSIDDTAFLIIFIHSINIGQHVQSGWFRYLWIFYGLSGLFFILYKRLTTTTNVAPTQP